MCSPSPAVSLFVGRELEIEIEIDWASWLCDSWTCCLKTGIGEHEVLLGTLWRADTTDTFKSDLGAHRRSLPSVEW
jgi:hypothetical protein